MKWSLVTALLALAACTNPEIVCRPQVVLVPGPVRIINHTVYLPEPNHQSALASTYDDLHKREASIVLKGKPRAIYKLIDLDMKARRSLEPVTASKGRPSAAVAKPAIKAIGDLQGCIDTGCQ